MLEMEWNSLVMPVYSFVCCEILSKFSLILYIYLPPMFMCALSSTYWQTNSIFSLTLQVAKLDNTIPSWLYAACLTSLALPCVYCLPLYTSPSLFPWRHLQRDICEFQQPPLLEDCFKSITCITCFKFLFN